MSTLGSQHERRAAQRFNFHLPISIRLAESEREEAGFTQDISARGAFFYTDCALSEGARVEVTLNMPSEVTLTESMRVRCRGKVLRVVRPATGNQIGVAVHLEDYEFLPEAAATAVVEGSYGRISGLHEHSIVAKDAGAGAENPTPHAPAAALPE